MMTNKDTDIREALRRKYADAPQLPEGFSERLTQRIAQQKSKRRRKWPFSTIAAIAASLLLLLTINHHDDNADVRQNKQPVQAKQAKSQNNSRLISTNTEHLAKVMQEKPLNNVKKQTKPHKQHETTAAQEQTHTPLGDTIQKLQKHGSQSSYLITDSTSDAKNQATTDFADDHLHYATNESVDTTCQPPSHMENFIVNIAKYNKVNGESLKCDSDTNDSTTVCTAYIFEDNEKLNLFDRLLQAACWYDSKAPGYLLNYSYKQFLFCLNDQHKGLKYLWLAERLRGKILLYCTHCPINTDIPLSCYQNYRDKLTNTYINTKTSEL